MAEEHNFEFAQDEGGRWAWRLNDNGRVAARSPAKGYATEDAAQAAAAKVHQLSEGFVVIDEPPPPPPPPPGPKVPSFNAKQLAAILPDLDDPEENFKHLEAALVEFGIGERDEVAMLLGQVAGETGNGAFFQELDNAAGTYLKSKPYYPYFGRGAIHLTWEENYRACSNYFGVDFVKNPRLVSQLQWRWRTACWYFAVYADATPAARRVDFPAVTAKVYGNSNPPNRQYRYQAYVRACQHLQMPWALAGRYRTRLDEGLGYVWPAKNEVVYEWWLSGTIPDRGPAWAKNAPPPDIDVFIAEGGFCASIPNLILRKAGKVMPYRTNLPPGVNRYDWDGGIAAYFGGVYGGAYYRNYWVPYDPDEDYPHGTLVGSPYWGAQAQGHVGIVLGNGRLLDLNSVTNFQSARYHSAAGRDFGFTVAIMPWNWINYEGDEW